MADKLHFSLVSPERELFSGEVDQVDAPGSEGMFGVLPNHAPFMATLKSGAVTVFDGTEKTRIFVRGGFADVTPQGLTILAEEAVDLKNLDFAAAEQSLQDAREDLADTQSEEDKIKAADRVAYFEALTLAAKAT